MDRDVPSTIHATSFGGQGQITGLTVDQAARAARALSGT
jgi:hypothetical protein